MQKRQEKITHVRKDSHGRLVEFKTDANKTYDYEMAIEAIENGHITNAELIKNRAGSKVIKGKNNESLDNLKEF